MHASRQDLHQLVQSMVFTEKDNPSTGSAIMFTPSTIAQVNGRIQICTLRDIPDLPQTKLPESQSLKVATSAIAYVFISSDHSPDGDDLAQRAQASATSLPTLRLHLDDGKRGQGQLLRNILPSALAFVGKHLEEGNSVVIACNSGKDASVGVAVAALQRYFDDNGDYTPSGQQGMRQ
jgi:tRNA A64-2'-O-ribosylphosphate transferase